jgi:hypothetical protein
LSPAVCLPRRPAAGAQRAAPQGPGGCGRLCWAWGARMSTQPCAQRRPWPCTPSSSLRGRASTSPPCLWKNEKHTVSVKMPFGHSKREGAMAEMQQCSSEESLGCKPTNGSCSQARPKESTNGMQTKAWPATASSDSELLG